MSVKLQKDLEDAEAVEQTNAEQAITLYSKIIKEEQDDKTDESINKTKEQAIYQLGKLFAKLGRAAQLSNLVKEIRPFFDSISKAKTAKIVRTLIDDVSEIPKTEALQIELCKESIQWAKETKRNFLRQRIETRLASLYLEAKQFQIALDTINNLVREVKRLHDKLLLVEIQLIESRIHHSLRNLPKARVRN